MAHHGTLHVASFCNILHMLTYVDMVGKKMRFQMRFLSGLQMHSGAVLLAAVVYNNDHWALVMHARKSNGSWQDSPAIIYDGKGCAVIQDHAAALMFHCSEVWRSCGPQPLKMCQTPLQEDNWSCGWRVLCALEASLQHWESCGELPTKLNDEEFGNAAVEKMLEAHKDKEDKRDRDDKHDQDNKEPIEPSARPKKRKPASPVSASDTPHKKPNLQGGAIARQHGVDHNTVFQQAHASAHIVVAGGHWSEFLKHLARASRSPCIACQQLQDHMLTGGARNALAEALVEDVGEGASVCDQAPCGEVERECEQTSSTLCTKKGRPKKGQQVRSVHLWMEKNRPGMYRRLAGEKVPYWCNICQKKIHCFRACDERYVLLHEKALSHKRGLGLVAIVAEPGAVEDAQPAVGCKGFLVSDEEQPLAKLSASVRNWFGAGCPHAKNREKEPPAILSEVRLVEEGEDLRFQSASCKGEESKVCAACSGLAKRAFKEFASWSFKVDLGQYCSALLYDQNKAERLLEVISERDYKKLGLAGVLMEQVLAIPDYKQRIAFIKSRFESYPKCRRSASLEKFMALTLPDHTLHGSTSEMAIYGDLVQLDFARSFFV